LNVLILGPTGVVGDAIVREAIADTRVGRALAVSRTTIEHSSPKLDTAILRDFSDFSSLEPALASVDVVLCALGVSWYQAKGEANYRRITHDYVMACARVASVANPSIRVCFVSGHGASMTGSQAWARIKAETEHDLEAMFGSRLTVFRPGYIYPVYGRRTPYWGDTVMKPLMPFRSVLSRWITDCAQVARAIMYVANGGTVPSPAGDAAISAAAAAYARS